MGGLPKRRKSIYEECIHIGFAAEFFVVSHGPNGQDDPLSNASRQALEDPWLNLNIRQRHQ
jgi:hypothetical protein